MWCTYSVYAMSGPTCDLKFSTFRWYTVEGPPSSNYRGRWQTGKNTRREDNDRRKSETSPFSLSLRLISLPCVEGWFSESSSNLQIQPILSSSPATTNGRIQSRIRTHFDYLYRQRSVSDRMTVLLADIIESVELWLRLIKKPQPYVDPNLDPVLLIPGVAGSILHAVDDNNNGKEERVWVRILQADYKFRTKLWSRFDPSTGN